MGVEAAALAYALDASGRCSTERYDLVRGGVRHRPARGLTGWLASAEGAAATIVNLGGYETDETGRIEWVE